MPYFDWNATTPMVPAARAAWLDASERCWGNASTPYRIGLQARLALDEARESAAGLLGVDAEQVIFTSGATEGNNSLIREAARRHAGRGTIWISAVEHPCVREAARSYWGPERVVTIPVTPAGAVDLDWLREHLAGGRPAVVCVMAINNETGVRQPLEEVSELCRAAGAALFCDAVQWMGKQLPPDDLCRRCDAVVASGHKFGGPKGMGLVVLGPEWRGIHLQAGGSQELGSRAGTENVPGILAMVAALQARGAQPLSPAQLGARDRFERELDALWPEEVVVHVAAASRTWNTSLVSLPRHAADRWIARLDRLGFQVARGSACSSAKAAASSALFAMGVDAETAARAVRISSGWDTAPEDWQALLAAIRQARRELDASGPAAGPGQVIKL